MAQEHDWSSVGSPVEASSHDWSSVGDAVDASGKPKEIGGFKAAAKQTIGQSIKGIGQLASDYVGADQDNAVKRYGQSVVDANPTSVHGFGDIVDKPLTTIKEAVGNAAGSMAGIVGSGALGRGIAMIPHPVAKVVGAGIAAAGPIIAGALPSYSGIREAQINDNSGNESDATSKALALAGAGTVGLIESKFGPQEWALSAMTKAGRDKLAQKFGESFAKSIPGAIGKGALRGGAIEGAEELVQNPVEQLASYQNPTTAENLKDTAFGGVMGAIGGGVLGGGMAPIGMKYAESKRKPVAEPPAEDKPEIAGLLPAPVRDGYRSDQVLEDVVDRENALNRAQANADQLYAERAAYEEAMDNLYLNGRPTITTDTAPLQQNIDTLLAVDEQDLKGLRKVQHKRQLETAFSEVVGITHDADGREIPLTMGALLDSQAMAEDAAKRQTATENANTRAQNLADEETAQQPDIAPGYVPPVIPVVGPLSAIANSAVQSGAHQTAVMQQAAAQAAKNTPPEGKAGTPAGAQNVATAPAQGPLTEVAGQAPNVATSAPNVATPASAFDVSGKNILQLKHLAAKGQPGWKEAATAELVRRNSATAEQSSAIANEQQAGAGLPAPTAGGSRPAPVANTPESTRKAEIDKQYAHLPEGNRPSAFRYGEGKQPWEMDSSEFSKQRNGNPHFDESFRTDGDYLRATQKTHEKIVAQAIADGLMTGYSSANQEPIKNQSKQPLDMVPAVDAVSQPKTDAAPESRKGIRTIDKWTAEELQARLTRGDERGDLSLESRQKIEAQLDSVNRINAEKNAKEIAKAERVAKMRAANEANKGTFLVGVDKDSAERVSVRNGTVYLGDYPAMDYETEDDIAVPEGATQQQVFDALINGKAVTGNSKIFGKNGPEKSVAERMAELDAERAAMSPAERNAAVEIESAMDAVVAASEQHGIEQSEESALSYIGASNEEIEQYRPVADEYAGTARQDQEGARGVVDGSEGEAGSSDQERDGNAQGQAGAVVTETSGQVDRSQWSITPYRYAKDSVVLKITEPDGFKGRLGRIAGSIGGRYTNRAGGYVMSETKARKIVQMAKGGWDANSFTNELTAPKAAEQEPKPNAKEAPSKYGIYQLADGSFAKFDRVWYRGEKTERAAMLSEMVIPGNSAPKDRLDSQSWVFAKGFSRNDFDGSPLRLTKNGEDAAVDAKKQEEAKPVALLSIAGREKFDPISLDTAAGVVARMRQTIKEVWKVDLRLVPTFSALPQEVKDAIAKYGEDTRAKGVLHKGSVYIVADEHASDADVETTILHEIKGHVGLRRLYSDAINKDLGALYMSIGGRRGLADLAKARGFTDELQGYAESLSNSDFTDEERTRIVMEELLSHIAQEPKFGDKAKAIVGKIRAWLRDNGFMALAKFGEADLLNILAKASKALETVRDDNGPSVLMTAWHGSPHDHDKFDSSKIGTGEGAQAYGHGLYFAGERSVAEYYRNAGSSAARLALDALNRSGGIAKEAIKELKKWDGGRNQSDFLDAISLLKTGNQNGRLYQVELAPSEDEYLDWDKPLSEQSELVRDALIAAYTNASTPKNMARRFVDDEKGRTGEDFYREMQNRRFADEFGEGSAKSASDYLHSIGIRGIRYLDGSSRDQSGTKWKDGVDPSKYDKMAKGVAENYLRERGNVSEAIKRLKADALASKAKQYSDAAAALESGDLVQDLNHNFVIFNDADVSITAKYNKAGNDKLTPADKAIYGMAAEGKSAAEILKFIASASRNPFNRQVASLLLKTGIAPSITVGDSKTWNIRDAKSGEAFAAAYDPKTNTVALFRPASAERNALHELIHAASLKALAKNGLASAQMKALFAHVEKTGKLTGMYGIRNVDEFIAEAFSNPKFQAALKQVSAAPVGGKPSSEWDWFIRVVRGILGLKQGADNALSQALDIGVGVMRENMGLNEAPKNANVRGMADKDNVAGTQAPTSAGDGSMGSAT
jgi:hypothetical protein